MPSYRSAALTMLLSLNGALGFGLRAAPTISTTARRTFAKRGGPVYSTAEAAAEATDEKKSNAPVKNELAYDKVKMEDIVSLCKRRGIIFPSSEIYNGFAGFYDYGPLGSELKKNVKDAWWTNFVRCREDVVGLDSSIIHNPTTWQSSGHLDGFSDPMVDCKETKLRYRADQLFCSPVVLEECGTQVGFVCVLEANDNDMKKAAKTQAKKLLREQEKKGQKIKAFDFIDLTQVDEETMAQVPSPGSGKPTLTMPRDFNLMFQTNVGAMQDGSSVAYLRPETAQGIFINYKNVLGTSRQKLPFGIAQIGKAFRNEITPRNFIFRSREFEQMEIEYFIPPGDDVWQPFHQQWIGDAETFLKSVGLKEELMGYDIHEGDGLAHYARACTDITFRFPFGVQELMGIAARGDFDLKAHTEGSGKVLDYYDEVTKEKFIPHVIEPSLGVDRLILALICSAYAEDEINGEKRNYLSFHPSIAPVKVAVLPLVKNKEPLVKAARELFEKLQRRWNVAWDQTGAIGRRYRRNDEIGVPFCITVDFETIEDDGAVTIRDRDSTEQVRIPMDEVIPYLSKQIDGY
jgi:glycyl-tRNA synthetase